jgi:hypothetical protein
VFDRETEGVVYSKCGKNAALIRQEGENWGRRMILRSMATPIRGSRSFEDRLLGPKRVDFHGSRNNLLWYAYIVSVFPLTL